MPQYSAQYTDLAFRRPPTTHTVCCRWSLALPSLTICANYSFNILHIVVFYCHEDHNKNHWHSYQDGCRSYYNDHRITINPPASAWTTQQVLLLYPHQSLQLPHLTHYQCLLHVLHTMYTFFSPSSSSCKICHADTLTEAGTHSCRLKKNNPLLPNTLTLQTRVILHELTVTQSTNSVTFMEPNGSLLCSQQPATAPYLESTESNLNPHILLPKGHLNHWVQGQTCALATQGQEISVSCLVSYIIHIYIVFKIIQKTTIIHYVNTHMQYQQGIILLT